jgi:hypothetical protein
MDLNFYINATSTTAEPDITTVNTDFSSSERFVIETLVDASGASFDNITVDDEFLITPLETTSTTSTTTNKGLCRHRLIRHYSSLELESQELST